MRDKLTVKELKEVIANLPDDMEVVVQQDAAGNGYKTAYAADPDCVWDKDQETIFGTNRTAEDNCLEKDEWEQLKKESPRVLVIAP